MHEPMEPKQLKDFLTMHEPMESFDKDSIPWERAGCTGPHSACILSPFVSHLRYLLLGSFD